MKEIIFGILMVFTLSVEAQYVDSVGNVMKSLVINELKSFDLNITKQDSLRQKIINSIIYERRNNPLIKESSIKKIQTDLILQELIGKSGDFHFLNPEHIKPPYNKYTDTVSSEIILLENKLKILNDSIRIIYERCKHITEDNNSHTRATREKAAIVLGTSSHYDDIKYIFDNTNNLNLGISYESNCWGCDRSAMRSFTSEYRDREVEKKRMKWRYFPFFIDYWGDPNWQGQENNFDFELSFFYSLHYDYYKPWLLYEFIQVNAKDPNTPILKAIAKFHDNFERQKLKYEQHLKNEKK